MGSTLDDLIVEAENLAKRGDNDAAMIIANQLVKESPSEKKVWSLRGYLCARSGEYSLAILDITQAITLNPIEPYLFHSRGRYRLSSGDNQGALDDFSRGLELSACRSDDIYGEDLHFWRAEVLIRLNRMQDALLDLVLVSDDYVIYTTELRTKADLIAICRG